jgi:hypothetical protein
MLGLLCCLALSLLSGCSKKENPEPSSKAPAENAAPATPIDPNTAAAVSGTVKFDGTPPKPTKIDTSQDATCKTPVTTEAIVVDGGNLANVFVYVKDGLGNRTFEAPKSSAVVLDQHGCRYQPHVLGVMATQNIEIRNSDPTTHNIHPTPRANREWNESQPPQTPPLNKSFAREEIMLPVKCNQHPWMKMFINVVKTPFFAVTDKDGKYEIKGLPAGSYTIAFVHEKLGEQDQQVTLAPKDTKTLDTSFKQ